MLRPKFLLALLVLTGLASTIAAQRGERRYEPVEFLASDGVRVYAKLYRVEGEGTAPVVVYFHDSSASADEYKSPALRLREAGYHGLAVDLRVGNRGNGSKSRTALRVKPSLGGQLQARNDLLAALEYAGSTFPGSPRIGVGCSYSAGLLLEVAGTRPELVDGVVAFSPAEIFGAEGVGETFVRDAASGIRCPVLITSLRAEEREWRAIFDAIPSGLAREHLAAGKGIHGARALVHASADGDACRAAFDAFLRECVALAEERGHQSGGTNGSASGSDDSTSESAAARVFVIGASMSDGMGLETNLAGVLEVMLQGERAPVDSASSTFLFANPVELGGEMLAEARAARPTLLVATDFLFWFGYGTMNAEQGLLVSESERLVLLDSALVQLEAFDCPIVVADYPNMEDAVGKMLLEAQLPEPQTLVALSERVRAWAAERSDVIVVPMDRIVREMRAGKAFTIGRHAWPEESTERMLQEDQLHPTIEGLCAIAHWIADALVARGVLTEDQVTLDLALVLEEYGEVFEDAAVGAGADR